MPPKKKKARVEEKPAAVAAASKSPKKAPKLPPPPPGTATWLTADPKGKKSTRLETSVMLFGRCLEISSLLAKTSKNSDDTENSAEFNFALPSFLWSVCGLLRRCVTQNASKPSGYTTACKNLCTGRFPLRLTGYDPTSRSARHAFYCTECESKIPMAPGFFVDMMSELQRFIGWTSDVELGVWASEFTQGDILCTLPYSSSITFTKDISQATFEKILQVLVEAAAGKRKQIATKEQQQNDEAEESNVSHCGRLTIASLECDAKMLADAFPNVHTLKVDDGKQIVAALSLLPNLEHVTISRNPQVATLELLVNQIQSPNFKQLTLHSFATVPLTSLASLTVFEHLTTLKEVCKLDSKCEATFDPYLDADSTQISKMTSLTMKGLQGVIQPLPSGIDTRYPSLVSIFVSSLAIAHQLLCLAPNVVEVTVDIGDSFGPPPAAAISSIHVVGPTVARRVAKLTLSGGSIDPPSLLSFIQAHCFVPKSAASALAEAEGVASAVAQSGSGSGDCSLRHLEINSFAERKLPVRSWNRPNTEVEPFRVAALEALMKHPDICSQLKSITVPAVCEEQLSMIVLTMPALEAMNIIPPPAVAPAYGYGWRSSVSTPAAPAVSPATLNNLRTARADQMKAKGMGASLSEVLIRVVSSSPSGA